MHEKIDKNVGTPLDKSHCWAVTSSLYLFTVFLLITTSDVKDMNSSFMFHSLTLFGSLIISSCYKMNIKL